MARSKRGRTRYGQSNTQMDIRPGKAFQVRTRFFDYSLLTVVIFLVCFGLVMLYSTSSYDAQSQHGSSFYFFKRQAFFAVLGFGAMWFVSRINYHKYARWGKIAYIGSLCALVLVWSPIGIEANEARRWIGVGSISFQPSELTKLAVIVFIPLLICKMGKEVVGWHAQFKLWGYGIVAAGAVTVITQNLSAGVIVMCITLGMCVVVAPSLKPYLIGGGIGLVSVVSLVFFVANSMENSENFRIRRLLAWVHPENYSDSGSFQTTQALYAIGSGGFFGKGLGNSTQKLVIPEAQNDMILSIIAEELGVFGVIVVLVLFGVLLYRLMFIAQNAPDMYGSLMATGIFTQVAIQVIFNIGVVTNIIPNTGISLPFISYGGTSLVFLMIEMGIALGISRTIIITEDLA